MAIIDKPTDYFNTLLYTGNGSDGHAITGVGFEPETVWLKKRSGVQSHQLFDSVRTAGKTLFVNENASEATYSNTLQSFDSDGFTLGTSPNGSGETYASWNWKAGGTAVSNTDGSITSSVSANTTAGFSVVSFTGTGANATVGHGLTGMTPKMVIIKSRSNLTDWLVYHSAISATNGLKLNVTDAQNASVTYFNNTEPTSSVFSIGTNADVNTSSGTYIAYCFANTSMIKCGKYTGNGSTDGTFVFTGMKPAFIITKRTDTTSQWQLLDNKRLGYNPSNSELYAESSEVENTVTKLDILSNGFKLRTTSTTQNASGGTYIYLAIAEQSFVTSTTNGSIPATAR